MVTGKPQLEIKATPTEFDMRNATQTWEIIEGKL